MTRDSQRPALSFGLIVALLAGLASVLAIFAVGAVQPSADSEVLRQLKLGDSSGGLRSTPADESDRVSVVIELHDEPAARVYAATLIGRDIGAAQVAARTQAQLVTIEEAQLTVLEQLTQLDAQILYRTQRVYNGIGVRMDADGIERIRNLPNVKAVHHLVPKRPANSRSVPHIDAPSIWQGKNGEHATGEGISIAIVDTGVDYLHVDFGGSGIGYEENDQTEIGDVVGFPGAKIIGGYDFAGDNYDADAGSPSFQPVPHPDPDPMDCYRTGQSTSITGHGTHVAGTAAGYGVTNEGITYTGSYSRPIDFREFQIGPGVAPRSTIYALKVFGCTGSSEIVDTAIEWAVDPNGDGDFSDHVDVLNMSLGSTYGSAKDPSAVASDNAALVGVIVVASAGNSGDTFFAVGSPSVASRGISVAAVVPGDPSDLSGEDQHSDILASFSARGVRREDSALKPDLAAPGFGVVSAQAGTGDGAYANFGTSMAAPHVAGSMALLRQLHPDLGVGSAENTAHSWAVEDIKALAINTAMRDIRTGTEASANRYSPTRIGGGEIDLENAAKARAIAYNADNPGQVSVSFGTPGVLDTTHLIKNVRVANKSTSTLTFTVGYSGVTDMPGVTFLLPEDLEIAVAPESVSDVPITLVAHATQIRHVRDITMGENPEFPRHWLSEEAGYIVFSPAGDHPILHVPIYASPRPASQMHVAEEQIDFGSSSRALGNIGLSGLDLRGTATPTNVVSLVSIFVLHHSSTRDDSGKQSAGSTGSYPHADLQYVGIASDYPTLKSGVSTSTSLEDSLLYWGIATHGNWTTPNEVEFNVFIDVDRDGVSDFRLFNTDRVGLNDDRKISDAFITALEDLRSGERSGQEFLNVFSAATHSTAIYNTNAIVLPLQAGAIELGEARSSFDYYVETYSKDVSNAKELGIYIDRSPVFMYDLARPGLDVSGGIMGTPVYEDFDGAELTVGFDLPAYSESGAKGLLVLHHHNLTGHRTQSVPIAFTQVIRRYLPIVRKQ